MGGRRRRGKGAPENGAGRRSREKKTAGVSIGRIIILRLQKKFGKTEMGEMLRGKVHL